MKSPNTSYVLSRTLLIILLLVIGAVAAGFVKKHKRKAKVVEEIKELSSEGSFYRQFSPESARKTLVKTLGLLMEANSLGTPPDEALDQSFGRKHGFFDSLGDSAQMPVRERIIRDSLRGNYSNLLKLGYKADPATLAAMREGRLPSIPSGPNAGRSATPAYVIDPEMASGLDKVIANFSIQPPPVAGATPTEVDTAIVRNLVGELMNGEVIGEAAGVRILKQLADPDAPAPAPESAKPAAPAK